MSRSLLTERILKASAHGGRDRERLLNAALSDMPPEFVAGGGAGTKKANAVSHDDVSVGAVYQSRRLRSGVEELQTQC